MIQKRRVLINALASVAQVVVSGVSFFVLYRFLYQTLGAAQVGVWATVLTATAINHLANLGLAGSTVMYVSRYLAQQRPGRVDDIIQTSVVSIAVFMGVVVAAAYPALRYAVAWIVRDAAQVPVALALLPYALASFWLVGVAQVVLSAIDGFERVDLRNGVLTAAALLYLGLAIALVPGQGLIGLARAQVIQSTVLVLGAWVVLRRLFAPLPLLPLRWDRRTFREMLGYNVQFQVTTIAQLLFDPVARALIARLGGLAAAGHFEMAYKVVVQLRALLATAYQAMVPTIANLQETAPALVQEVYRKSYRLVLYLVAASLPLCIALTPVLSEVYLGAYERTFVVFADLLFAGWFLNLLTTPAYYANLGTGELRGNVEGHLVSGVLNIGLGFLLGLWYGGLGVVIGFVVALLAGNVVTVVRYQHRHAIPARVLLDRESFVLGGAALVALATVLLLYARLSVRWNPLVLGLLMVAVYGAVVGGPLWRHPMRERLSSWLHTLIPSR